MIRTPYAFFHVVFVQFAPLKKKHPQKAEMGSKISGF